MAVLDRVATAGPGSPGPRPIVLRWLGSSVAARLAGYLSLVLLWQLASMLEPRFPAPVETVLFLVVEATGSSHGGIVRGQFVEHFAATLPRFTLSIAISMVIGIGVGILIGSSRIAEALLKDTLLVLLALPAIIWAFLTQMWFGLGDDAVILTTVLSAFPFAAVNVVQGVQAIPRDLHRMSRTFGVGARKRILQMQVPAVMG
jgi:ABC-type nitrate/sulfonate/bicarbonate transport system permease component